GLDLRAKAGRGVLPNGKKRRLAEQAVASLSARLSGGRRRKESHARVIQYTSSTPIPGARLGMIKLLAAPVRSIVRFPLFQLAVVVAVILFLQAGNDNSARGHMFNGLDKLVESTIGLFSALFNLKSFTKSWLTTGFWIAYVYLGCLLILFFLR